MNLLITGAWQDAENQVAALEALGHKVVFHKNEKERLPCEYEWVEGVVCNGLFLHHSYEKFVSLKYVQLTSAGLDRVPLKAFEHSGIKVNSARGVYSIPMAEFAVLSVLQFYKKSREFSVNQVSRRWEKKRDLDELTEKTVCIVGCGSIGCEVAKRFKAFDCEIIGVDIAVNNDPHFDRICHITELDACLSLADVVVLTLPLTKDTYHIIDENKLSLLKPRSVIVNISRGAIIDTIALTVALKKKDIYAALDVFEEEPLSGESDLWNMENVIITPHNSFVSRKNLCRLTELVFKNLKEI